MNPLTSFAAQLMEAAANAALAMDPIAQQALSSRDGQRIALVCTRPEIDLEISIRGDQLAILNRASTGAQARVSGEAANLLQGLWQQAPIGVTIDGDESLVVALREVFSQLELDFARPLAMILGPDRANTIVGASEAAFGGVGAALKAGADGFRHDVTGSMATWQDAEPLLDSIDQLRERLDRLDARVRLAEDSAAANTTDDSAS